MNKLKAGAGSAEIRFPAAMFPTDKLFGVHDNPHVRILLLEAGIRFALVAMELVNGDACVEPARQKIAGICGVDYDHIWVHVTHPITTPHTPGGPGETPGVLKVFPGGKKPAFKMDPEGPRKKELFLSAIDKAVEEAAEAAVADFREAVYGVGTGQSDIACNRDVETPFGYWTGLNPEGITNRKMTVLRVDGVDGKPIGFVLSYGIKPCAIDMADMDGDTRQVCTDVPGVACKMVENTFSAPCLFCMSAAGDQVPREMAFVDTVDENGKVGHMDLGFEKGLEIVERLGKEMGDTAVQIAMATIADQAETELVHAKANLISELKTTSMAREPSHQFEYTFSQKDELEAEGLKLGDDFAFVAIKPETNAQTERELWEGSPFEHTVLISMVNGGMKYMPDQGSYDRSTWEAGNSMLMPGMAEKWVARSVDMLKAMKNGTPEPVVTAVAEPYPDGARISKAVLEFAGEVPDVSALQVVDRNIVKREVNGNTVTLYLDPEDDAAKIIPGFKPNPNGPFGGPGGGINTIPGAGGPGGPNGGPGGGPKGGPNGGPGANRAMGEKKLRPVAVEVIVPGIETPVGSTKKSLPIIEDFIPGTYKRILYNLYIPKNYDPEKKYPLVMFIPDASANGSQSILALYQGIGATCWARPERQEKDPCFVLAVQIPNSVHLTNDDYEVTDEIGDIMELLMSTVRDYSIDRNRIYTTGQSQGCMASCELLHRYPDLFAGAMLISGHWAMEKLEAMTDQKLFFGLSEGGLKEYPCFNEATEKLSAKGVKIATVRLNFRDGFEVNDRKVREAVGDAQDVYVIFDKATAFPEGKVVRDMAHHARGWELCYQLDAALDWLLAQRKENS